MPAPPFRPPASTILYMQVLFIQRVCGMGMSQGFHDFLRCGHFQQLRHETTLGVARGIEPEDLAGHCYQWFVLLSTQRTIPSAGQTCQTVCPGTWPIKPSQNNPKSFIIMLMDVHPSSPRAPTDPNKYTSPVKMEVVD